MEIIWHWGDLEELRARSGATPWVLVEATKHEVLVSPIFDAGLQGCFDCYLRRRLSTGALGLSWISEIGLNHFDLVKSLVSESTRLLAGAVSVAEDGSTSAHRLLPVPGCPCWHRAPRISTWDTLTSLVNPFLGVVPHFQETRPARLNMKAVITYGTNTAFIFGRRAANVGLAADWSVAGARRRAAAESVERYCAAFVPPQTIAGGDNLGVPGRRWGTGADVRGRETDIYFPFTGTSAKHIQTSEGLATGDSIESATEHACAELIERDTLITSWQQLSGWRRHRRKGDMHLTDLQGPLGWNISVAWVLRSEMPYLVMGIAARRDAIAAQESAIKELACIEAFASEIGSGPAFGIELLSRRLREQEREAVRFSQFLSFSNSTRIREAPPDFDVFDVTTEDIRNAGWAVVRALRTSRIEME